MAHGLSPEEAATTHADAGINKEMQEANEAMKRFPGPDHVASRGEKLLLPRRWDDAADNAHHFGPSHEAIKAFMNADDFQQLGGSPYTGPGS